MTTACARTVPVPAVTSTRLRPARMRRTGDRSKSEAPRAGGRFCKAQARAKRIEREAARADGGASVERCLLGERGRGHPRVVEARRATRIVLAPQPPDGVRVPARHVQQVLRHQIAPDVRRLIAAAKSSEARRSPCQSVLAARRPCCSGRVLERRVEVLADQPERRRRAASANPIRLEDDRPDAGGGKRRRRRRIRSGRLQ